MDRTLTTADIRPLESRDELTTLQDSDILAVVDSSDLKIKKISWVNTKKVLDIDGIIDPMKGEGWSDENLVDHEERVESLESKVGQAVNENSNVKFNSVAIHGTFVALPHELMGFAPRDLKSVFGTPNVDTAFEELRGTLLTDGFKYVRLADYIDLEEFTLLNWHNQTNGQGEGKWSVNTKITPNASYENTRVEIVEFNPYLQVGNASYPTVNHVGMMFKQIPVRAAHISTNTNSGGYPSSDIKSALASKFLPAIIDQFGSATPRAVDRYLSSPTSGEWVGSEQLFLPTAMNIYGTQGDSYGVHRNGTQTLFALYALNPNRKLKLLNGTRNYWWLAEPVKSTFSSAHFTYASYYGHLHHGNASNVYGVVPALLI